MNSLNQHSKIIHNTKLKTAKLILDLAKNLNIVNQEYFYLFNTLKKSPVFAILTIITFSDFKFYVKWTKI